MAGTDESSAPAQREPQTAVAPLNTIVDEDVAAASKAVDDWLRSFTGGYVTLERLTMVLGSLPNRVAAGKPTSCFCDWNAAIRHTDEAWANGTQVPGRPGVKDYEFGTPIGEGPKGGAQSKVRVHEDSKGKIHGHPAGPEIPKGNL